MTQDDVQAKWSGKIAALLRKAESTTPEEAEALTAKAMELMTMYAIDEQMIAHAAGRQVQEEITKGEIHYTGIFMVALMDIGFSVARHNNCRAFFRKVDWTQPKRHEVHLFGFTSDVERTKLLAASLEIQCTRSMAQWRKTCDVDLMSKMNSFKARRQFIFGFVQGMNAKLREARDAGQREAVNLEAERSHVAADEAKQSVALVVTSRKRQVDDWFDNEYGRGLRSVSRRYQSGGADAHGAGVAAGRSANIGQPGVGGSRGSIGRG